MIIILNVFYIAKSAFFGTAYAVAVGAVELAYAAAVGAAYAFYDFSSYIFLASFYGGVFHPSSDQGTWFLCRSWVLNFLH